MSRMTNVFERYRAPAHVKDAVQLGDGYEAVMHKVQALREVKDLLEGERDALTAYLEDDANRSVLEFAREEAGRIMLTIPKDRPSVLDEFRDYMRAERSLAEVEAAVPLVDRLIANLDNRAMIIGSSHLAERITDSEPLLALTLKDVRER